MSSQAEQNVEQNAGQEVQQVEASEFLSQQEWLETIPPTTDQLVQLSSKDRGIFFETIYADMGIAEAAENAVAFYLSQQDRFPEGLIYATVYWADGATWGPFPVDVSITVEATCLRQGD